MDSAFVQKAIQEIRDITDTVGVGAGEKAARRFAAEDPDNPVLLAEWSELLLWTGETSRAEEVANRALALDRYCGPAHSAMATYAAVAGDAEVSMRHYLHAQNVAPNTPETLLAGVNAYTVAGETEEALKCARLLYKLAPRSPRAWSALHYGLRCVNLHDEAEAQLSSAPPEILESGIYSLAIARNYLKKGDAIHAEMAAREAVERSPECNGAWSTLAMACEFQGNVNEAVDAAARALEINCHDTVALRLIQRVARTQGDLDMAAKASLMAEEAAPFIKGDTTFYQVLELVEKGEYESALEMAIELEKTISNVHEKSLRGVVLMLLRELGRWTELEQKLNQVAAFAEFDPDCHAAAASLAAHRGDFQGAIEILKIGLQRYPESTQLRAQYLMDLGRAMKTEELELATADVLALHIGNPAGYSELVDGLYEAGQVDAALELLHKGLEAFPEDDVLGLLALSLMLDQGDFRAA